MELKAEKFVEVHVHYFCSFFLRTAESFFQKYLPILQFRFFTNILTFHQLQISTNTAEDSVCPLGSVVTHSDQMYAASHTRGMSVTRNKV